jgi:hypothetical protein
MEEKNQRLFPYGFVLLWRKEGKRKVALFLPLVFFF